MAELIQCRKCNTPKSEEEFQLFRNGDTVGRRHVCRRCRNSRIMATTSPTRRNELFKKRTENLPGCWLIKYRYKMTQEEYAAQFEKQGGVCAICKRPPTACRAKRRLCVDHNHKTKNNRGLLCTSCNVILGRLENNPGPLEAFIRYVAEWKEKEEI